MSPRKKIFFSLVSVFVILQIASFFVMGYMKEKEESRAKLGGDIFACKRKDSNEGLIAATEKSIAVNSDGRYPEMLKNSQDALRGYQEELQQALKSCDRVKAWETKYRESAGL